MHHVKCKIYTKVECKDKLVVPKLDGLHKHNQRRKCKQPKPRQKVGEFYTNANSQHAKNKKIYGTTTSNIVKLNFNTLLISHNSILGKVK